MKFFLSAYFFCIAISGFAQTNMNENKTPVHKSIGVVELRSYNLKPGSRDAYHKLVIEKGLPMLKSWDIDVLGYGPSQSDDSSYYLIRAFNSVASREKIEDDFYGSDEWKNGPRASILALIQNYTTIVLPVDSIITLSEKIKKMISFQNQSTDSVQLSALNAQFIKNFLNQDVSAHSEIIHKDFVCIEGNGNIVPRDVYMKKWATDFDNSGYVTFSYKDECIRIFGDMALIRSKTVYTKNINGNVISGNSVYTDTYIKENGKWYCVQAQITPVK